jgi:hypothetical protein
MVRLKKLFLILLAVLALAALSACAPGETVAPTPTAVDLDAVMTAAAATAYVQLTQIAAAATPTSAPVIQPTAAPADAAVPTGTSVVAPTATLGGVIVETPAGGLPTATQPTPILTNTPVPVVVNPGPVCLNSAWVEDVTVPDGTVFKPWEKFTKGWRIKNTGTCAWDEGFGLKLWAGPAMGGNAIYFSGGEKVEPGGIVDLYIKMFAPGDKGDYIAHWIMVSDTGKTFGGDFTVVIKVAK